MQVTAVDCCGVEIVAREESRRGVDDADLPSKKSAAGGVDIGEFNVMGDNHNNDTVRFQLLEDTGQVFLGVGVNAFVGSSSSILPALLSASRRRSNHTDAVPAGGRCPVFRRLLRLALAGSALLHFIILKIF